MFVLDGDHLIGTLLVLALKDRLVFYALNVNQAIRLQDLQNVENALT